MQQTQCQWTHSHFTSLLYIFLKSATYSVSHAVHTHSDTWLFSSLCVIHYCTSVCVCVCCLQWHSDSGRISACTHSLAYETASAMFIYISHCPSSCRCPLVSLSALRSYVSFRFYCHIIIPSLRIHLKRGSFWYLLKTVSITCRFRVM